MNDSRLDPDEDAELRRLHMLKGFGMVASSVVARYEALRGRDRRKAVRNPDETNIAAPVMKAVWSSNAMMKPVKTASSMQGFVSDTREIFGEQPEPRRGLGIFRR
jgi:hypothetical protein